MPKKEGILWGETNTKKKKTEIIRHKEIVTISFLF